MNPLVRPRLDAFTLSLLLMPPFFWASNAVLGRFAVGWFEPFMLNTLRWAVAALLLAPFIWPQVRAHRQQIFAHWRVLMLLGFLGIGCYNALQYLALQTSTAVNVTLIAAAGPVSIIAVGALFFNEPMTRRQVAGALLCVVGVLWVMARGVPARLIEFNLLPGDLYIVVATITWSFYTWILRRHRPDLPLMVMMLAQMIAGVLVLLPFAAIEAWLNGVPTPLNSASVLMVLYAGIFPGLLSYLCWDRGVARAGAMLPVFFANLTPIFAALMSTVMLGEAPQGFHAVGVVFILCGIVLAQRFHRADAALALRADPKR